MQTLQQPHNLSSSNAINPLSLLSKLSSLTLYSRPRPSTIIRMGGGPRTYPGGVSKWQWKRMQANKAKQLLKARLNRERQIYEMRKRAELKAAVAELERPWEVVQKAAPKSSALFSVSADEQLKVLADRFQKPGGFDLWSDYDGPQLFVTPDDGLPSARFFPKGVVHSVKPYGRISGSDEGGDSDVGLREDGKLGIGLFSSGSEDDDWDGDVESVGRRVGHDGQRGFLRGGSRNSRGRRNGRVGNGSFVGKGEGFDGEGSRGSYGYDNRERKDGQSRFSKNGLRNSRGRRTGRAGNGSFVGESEGFDGDDNGERDDGQSGFSRNGLRNSRGRRSVRGKRLGNGSFDGEVKELNGGNYKSLDSRGSIGGGNGVDQRGSRNWSGGNYKTDMNGVNLGGRKVNYGARSDSRRWSSRGRSVGRSRGPDTEDVYDMSLQHDGSYGISSTNDDV